MADEFPLHEGFSLYTTPEEYILQPSKSGRALVFDRKTRDVRLTPLGSATQYAGQGKLIYGLFGVLPLPTTDILILITSAKFRGKLLGHPVYLASHFLLLPITTRDSVLPVESKLMSLVYKHLEDGKFWFSYEWDLTRSFQAQAQIAQQEGSTSFWERADDKFFWNKYLQTRVIRLAKATGDEELNRFILPVTYGSFDLRTSMVGGQSVQFALMSRRSRYRAGTRYNTRGVDANGNPGNFNESEQILIVPAAQNSEPPRVVSHVQTRGSAPFYWAEIVNLVFVPDLIVMDKGDQTAEAFQSHINSQRAAYGKVMLLNLVKGRGRERHIKEAYEQLALNEKVAGEGVDYEYFDVHTETHGDKWYRVDEEAASFDDKLVDYGYCEMGPTADSPLAKRQQGVVRSNCMDCLDRTNLMQTAVAKRVVDHQLHNLGILKEDQKVEDEKEFMLMFRDVWSDHGNFIAKAYTGTGALRSDFTRTGVRTRKGVVTDKLTSLWRYIMNNHMDGYKQDAFDLMTGAWVPGNDTGLAWMLLHDKRPWHVRLMPYIVFFALLMIIATIILPRTSTYPTTYPFFLWTSIFTASLAFVVRNPIDYVAWPRLNYQPTLDAIYYHGPGARTRKGSIARGGGIVQAKWEGEKTYLAEAAKVQ